MTSGLKSGLIFWCTSCGKNYKGYPDWGPVMYLDYFTSHSAAVSGAISLIKNESGDLFYPIYVAGNAALSVVTPTGFGNGPQLPLPPPIATAFGLAAGNPVVAYKHW